MLAQSTQSVSDEPQPKASIQSKTSLQALLPEVLENVETRFKLVFNLLILTFFAELKD